MGKAGVSFLVVLALVAGTSHASAQTIAEAESESRLAWQAPMDLPINPTTPVGVPAQTPDLQSPWVATGLSLVLPGAGQWYAGAYGRAKVFFGAEVVIWGLALAFDRSSAWKHDDAINYATAHAQLDPAGKDDEFLERLEFYVNRNDYNNAGRIIDPTRPYLPDTRETYWQWDSPTSQETFKGLRNDSRTAARNRTFMMVTALVNRFLSAVDAFRTVSRNNAHAKQQEGLKLSVHPEFSLYDPGIAVRAQLRF